MSRFRSPADVLRAFAHQSLVSKTIVVTGGNRGIGYETCASFLSAGATVVMLSRSLEDAVEPAKALRASPSCRGTLLEPVECDLGSMTSTVACSKRLEELCVHGGIDALILNAGCCAMGGLRRTQDGHELNFAVNYLGHALLFRRLVGSLAQGSRVIALTSDAVWIDPEQASKFLVMPHPPASTSRSAAEDEPTDVMPNPLASAGGLAVEDEPIDEKAYRSLLLPPEDICAEESMTQDVIRYTWSKWCVILLVLEAQRLHGEHVTVFAVNPGSAIPTGIFRDFPAPVRWGLNGVGWLQGKTAAKGAATTVFATVAEGLQGGDLLVDCRVRNDLLTEYMRSAQAARDLWEITDVILAGL